MIQLCCPDMGEATNIYMIKEIEGQTYIPWGTESWVIDYCPFCGKRIVLIQSTGGTQI